MSNEHLFLKGFTVSKDLESGKWVLSLVSTNKGVFALPGDLSEHLDQLTVDKFTKAIKTVLSKPLSDFLEKESNEATSLIAEEQEED